MSESEDFCVKLPELIPRGFSLAVFLTSASAGKVESSQPHKLISSTGVKSDMVDKPTMIKTFSVAGFDLGTWLVLIAFYLKTSLIEQNKPLP